MLIVVQVKNLYIQWNYFYHRYEEYLIEDSIHQLLMLKYLFQED